MRRFTWHRSWSSIAWSGRTIVKCRKLLLCLGTPEGLCSGRLGWILRNGRTTHTCNRSITFTVGRVCFLCLALTKTTTITIRVRTWSILWNVTASILRSIILVASILRHIWTTKSWATLVMPTSIRPVYSCLLRCWSLSWVEFFSVFVCFCPFFHQKLFLIKKIL